MPGIEHYRRKDADGSLPLPPAKIASLLFSTLIEGGESIILNEQRERFEKVTDFDVNAFDRVRFIYLAANVAVLLTQFATNYPTVAEIIPPLRELVLHAMRERWRDSEDSADEAIEKASAAYAALAYTNPATDRGISFDWPQTWLTEVGIAEYNPITLFQIAHTFRNYHLHALQFISSVVAGEQQANAQAAPESTATPNKADLARRWQTEEASLSGTEAWTILLQAARVNGEEVLGWGWVPMHDPKAPTATVCFHRDAATTLLRTLYSTFAALNDPDDYLKQIGLGWALKARPPSAGMVGSAQGYGSAQIHVDWSGPTRYATFMIYPADSRRIHVTLGIESVAHLIQLITEAFDSLEWPVPP